MHDAPQPASQPPGKVITLGEAVLGLYSSGSFTAWIYGLLIGDTLIASKSPVNILIVFHTHGELLKKN